MLVSDTPFDTTPPKFNGKSLAVVIAVPVCVVLFVVFLFAVCWFTRKQRRLPEGIRLAHNGKSKSKRGYAEGRSRRARTGVEKTNDEFELGSVGGYRDEPGEVYADNPEEGRRDTHEE
jgi:hypothetical protein